MDTLSEIKKKKIITIVRGLSLEDTLNAVAAVIAGGLNAIEVTYCQNQEDIKTIDIIHALNETFGSDILLGAGTVMTMNQLQSAYQAGAKYIISPHTDITLIHETKQMGLISIPGAYTASEIVSCYAAGADIIKVFPAETGGPEYIKALRSPLAHIPLAAVGGVNLNNINDFFKAGVCCVGIGSNIIDKQAVSKRNFQKIRELSAAYAVTVAANNPA